MVLARGRLPRTPLEPFELWHQRSGNVLDLLEQIENAALEE